MKVSIDTNVILDVLIGRESHLEASSAFLKLCGRQVTGLIAASQTTDIFFLLCREGHDAQTVKAFLKKLVNNVKVIGVTAADVSNALASDMTDFEDALLAYCGQRQKAEYIITRNEKDFGQSPVPALTPHAFLDKFYS